MTLYGIDISNFQQGMDLARVAAEGFSWVEAKVSEGDYYTDPNWPAFKAAAAAVNLPIIGYHYAVAACSPAAQVSTYLGNSGPNVCMIDFEVNSGTLADYWALVRAFNAAGVTVALTYLPRWYWVDIGCPDLSGVPGLVASNYPGGSGYATDLYAAAGGDAGPGWAPYGNATPVIWQFSDSAQVAGRPVDADAFRGTPADLTALLTGAPQGAFMALTDDQQTDLYAKVQAIWAQLLGPQGHGWAQLGTNTTGQTLTPVDAVATLETQVAAIAGQVNALAAAVAAIAAKVGA